MRRATDLPRLATIVLVIVFFALAALHSGTQTYLDAVDTWTEEKLARAQRAIKEPRARIWSKKCEAQGKDVLAMRADKGPWQVHCIPRRVLTVVAHG